MIIIGYPGIGKSSVAGIERGVIDLESSLFHDEGDNSKWADRYCKVARDLSRHGYTVCISSHSEVLEHIKEYHRGILVDKIALVYPTLTKSMRDFWINKLQDRYYASRAACRSSESIWNFEKKDLKALHHVQQHYYDDILKLQKECVPHYEISDPCYDMSKIIEECKKYFKYFNNVLDIHSVVSEKENENEQKVSNAEAPQGSPEVEQGML